MYNPSKTLLLEEKERLRDISHAYGLLLFHYKRGDQNLKNRKILEVSNAERSHLYHSYITNSQDLFVYYVARSEQRAD